MSKKYEYFISASQMAGINFGVSIIRKSHDWFGREVVEMGEVSESLERKAYQAALTWAQSTTGIVFPNLVLPLLNRNLIPCPPEISAQVTRWRKVK